VTTNERTQAQLPVLKDALLGGLRLSSTDYELPQT